MDHAWIETYGPWAVLVGGVLEGETVFIAAGYAISQGYLDPALTLMLATLGGSLGDVTWYGLGRWKGSAILTLMPALRGLQARSVRFLRRWGRAASFLMRFAYGLRIALPVSIGASRFPGHVFVPFNLLGAVTFASVYLLIGYFFGEIAEEVLRTVEGSEPWILLSVALTGGAVWAVREWTLLRSGRRAVREEGSGS